ncbi:hypothetical protein OAO01_05040 [Oligoflexia bacterium]|nr:hypothetical protein [Oligoflexia bacterium]
MDTSCYGIETITAAELERLRADTDALVQSLPDAKESARLMEEYYNNLSTPRLKTRKNVKEDGPCRWRPSFEHIGLLCDEICDNLNKSQRALIAERLSTLERGSNQYDTVAPSQTEAARLFNVSSAYIKLARKLQAVGNSRLIKAVASGEMSLRGALQACGYP